MNTIAQNTVARHALPRSNSAAPLSLGTRLESATEHATRLSVVTVLGWIGAMKFTAYEAGAIEGLVASSPLTAWLYSVFSLQGASILIGTVEISIALLLLLGFVHRGSAILGASGAIATFAVTLSYLFTSPGWEASLGGFPALSVVPGQFLLKDIVLLVAAFSLLGKALTRTR